MSAVKVLEVLVEGNSIENAAENAVKEAGATVKSIQSVYIKDINAIVENNAISRYRINAKVSFKLER